MAADAITSSTSPFSELMCKEVTENCSRLSFECQRRHFNPEFKTKETFKDGRPRYQSTVIVKDIVINSNTFFDDPTDAKAHVAEKALKYIRREWPRGGLPPSHGGTPVQTAVRNKVEDLSRRQEELRQRLKQRHQTRSVEPPQSSPSVTSGVDMTDPAQARAFVEGFKIGQLAAQRGAAGGGSSPPSAPQSRRRSRSPGRRRSSSQGKADESYRQRSPVRDATKSSRGVFSPPRYFDGSRHGMLPHAIFINRAISEAHVLGASQRPLMVCHML